MIKIVKTLSISLLLSVQALTLGCTSTSNPIEQITLAEPLTANYKHEVAIARLTEVILRAKVTDGERAQFYYDVGFNNPAIQNLIIIINVTDAMENAGFLSAADAAEVRDLATGLITALSN